MRAVPSVAVVRSLIAAHDPELLVLMDALKEKFGAKLLTLKIPAANISLGPVERCQAEYDRAVPFEPGGESLAQARDRWKSWKKAQRTGGKARK